MHGPLDHEQLIKKLHDADLFVHPCEYESFGISILEAMASGLPGIVGNCGGQTDFFENGRHGYLIAPGDSVELASRIQSLLLDSHVYEKHSKNAIETAKQFTWKRFAELHLEMYNHAMKKKKVDRKIPQPL